MKEKKEKKRKIRYYVDDTTDFYQGDSSFTLSEDYRWIRPERTFAFLSSVVYALALLFSVIYCRLFLHVRIKGKKCLRQVTKKSGFFLYGNHTQPIGDVFTPALACFPRRIYTIVSPANFALPVIGKLLPALGALPLAHTLREAKEFGVAIEQHLHEGHPIILYPEAHVWDYYTGIRSFDSSSFRLPIRYHVPTFCMTTTYQKRKWSKKPRITLYLDGPFYPEGDTVLQKQKNLQARIFSCMSERAKESNICYIEYVKRQG